MYAPSASLQARVMENHYKPPDQQSEKTYRESFNGNEQRWMLMGSMNDRMHIYYLQERQQQPTNDFKLFVVQRPDDLEPDLTIPKTPPLLLAFRGTKTFDDVIADLTTLPNILSESERYKQDKEKIDRELLQSGRCTEQSPCDVFITGHSLGGAVAMEISDAYKQDNRLRIKGGHLFNSFFQPKDFEDQRNERLFVKHYMNTDPLYKGEALPGVNVGILTRGILTREASVPRT
jgi:hypothetical protein